MSGQNGGQFTIIVGVVCLLNPFAASIALERMVAWSFLLIGIFVLLSAFMGNKEGNGRFGTILLGIVMILVGIFMFRNLLAGILSIAWMVGIFMIVSGFTKIIVGMKIRDKSWKWVSIISGVASLILAMIVFSTPVASLGLLLGFQLISDGAGLCALAIARKQGGVAA